jgi:hypothetical protein
MDTVRGLGFLPHAIIGRAIDQLSRTMNAKTETGHDEFDEYEGVAFALDDGLPFTLKHYKGHPVGTVTVYLPHQIHEVSEITDIIASIMRDLGLGPDALLWQRADNPEL